MITTDVVLRDTSGERSAHRFPDNAVARVGDGFGSAEVVVVDCVDLTAADQSNDFTVEPDVIAPLRAGAFG